VDRLRVIEQYKDEMNLTPEAHQLLVASRKKVNRQTRLTMGMNSVGLLTVFTIVFVITLDLVNKIMLPVSRKKRNLIKSQKVWLPRRAGPNYCPG
jgi:hypothetical protein